MLLRPALKKSLRFPPLVYHIRWQSTIEATATVDRNAETKDVKPFSDIPVVPSPMLTMLGFIRGKYSFLKLHEFFDMRVGQYGEIYREKIGVGEYKVHTANPEDFSTVFQQETRSKPPKRDPIWSLKAYHERSNLPLSIVDMQGDTWSRVRDSLRPITVPKEIFKMVPTFSAISDEFFEYIERTLLEEDTRIIHDFQKHISRWTFENAGMVVFRQRLGMFKPYHEIDEDIRGFYEGHLEFFKNWVKIEFSLPHHRHFRTKVWRNFQDVMDKVVKHGKVLYARFDDHYVTDRNANLTDDENFILHNDVLRAAIDTISQTAMWTVIELSKNPRVQENIYKEVTAVLGDQQTITVDILQDLSYVRGVLKESFRLHPLVVGHSRILQSDAVLSGYEVPAGTNVSMIINSYNKKKYFGDHQEFKPERWIRTHEKRGPVARDNSQKYTVMPFGHGMRSCPGRRIAENELLVFIAKLIKNYKIFPVNENIGSINEMIIIPDQKVHFRFEKR